MSLLDRLLNQMNHKLVYDTPDQDVGAKQYPNILKGLVFGNNPNPLGNPKTPVARFPQRPYMPQPGDFTEEDGSISHLMRPNQSFDSPIIPKSKHTFQHPVQYQRPKPPVQFF